MATHLTRTSSSSPTGTTTWTYSAWIKKGVETPSASQKFFSAGSSSSDRTEFYFGTDGSFNIYKDVSGSAANLASTRLFGDPSAWYHFVVQNNNGTVTVYVNNETVSLSGSNLGTNKINAASTVHYVGRQVADTTQNFFGMISHFHFVDGSIVAPTVFGETDSTTGIWKIKSSPSVTYGDDGFFILKDGNNLSGSTVQDQSGKGNNFTATGNLTSMKDCPDNVFATLNDKVRTSPGQPTYSHLNNTQTPNAGQYQNAFSTLGMTGGGKYYWEIKVNGTANSANYMGVSNIVEFDNRQQSGNVIGANAASYSVAGSGGGKRTNDSNSSYGSTFADGDIMMGALDLDNGKIFFGKNGSWFDSGNPATGANPAFSSISASEVYLLGATVYNGGYTSINWNFGNGYFGTTAITTNSNNGYSGAEGSSKFNYQPPTGFSALSTKGLNE